MDVLRGLVVPVGELNTSVQGQIKPLKQKLFVNIEPKFSPLVVETRLLFHYQGQTVTTVMQSSTLWSWLKGFQCRLKSNSKVDMNYI